ncbi:MAG: hypothetical protein ACD_48C00483G0001 [uncultured bacterium]|nr:MAG: hypothetical protein ACD_48C00483G0001 [uncultured bacterium]
MRSRRIFRKFEKYTVLPTFIQFVRYVKEQRRIEAVAQSIADLCYTSYICTSGIMTKKQSEGDRVFG